MDVWKLILCYVNEKENTYFNTFVSLSRESCEENHQFCMFENFIFDFLSHFWTLYPFHNTKLYFHRLFSFRIDFLIFSNCLLPFISCYSVVFSICWMLNLHLGSIKEKFYTFLIVFSTWTLSCADVMMEVYKNINRKSTKSQKDQPNDLKMAEMCNFWCENDFHGSKEMWTFRFLCYECDLIEKNTEKR